MESLDAEAKLLRLASDLVQRRQSVVNVKNRILESLRHDRAGELLKLENKLHVFRALFFVQIFRKTEEQQVTQKIKDRFFNRRIALFRRRDCALDDVAIFLARGPSWFAIAAVNRKTGDRFAARTRQSLQRIIPKPTVLLGEPIHH